ncbi:phospholipase [Frondihabitans australicus]|uniref:aggregation-promoting factor C-terminal-like domain-containing protein n=1 Tax=Frondihabitans australicus TaxID=386892 RepID=UPI001B878D2A|nr:phospholipase [Frondihabitans australicus]
MPFRAFSRNSPTTTSTTAEPLTTATGTQTVTTATGTRRAISAQRAAETRRRRTRRLRIAGIAGAGVVAAACGTGFAFVGTSGASNAFGLPSATPSAAPTQMSVTHSGDGTVSVHAGSAVTRQVADSAAQTALATGHLVAENAEGKTNAAELTQSMAQLADYRTLAPDTVIQRVNATQSAAQAVGARTTVATARIEAIKTANEKKAQIEAQKDADAARQAAANTPAAAQATAQKLMASQYGWGSDQFSCLVNLWNKESGWNYKAYNASGATGIPQALPGSKMSSVASDWATNATTQIIWGLGYIQGSYGTPCAAWAHSEANNWY